MLGAAVKYLWLVFRFIDFHWIVIEIFTIFSISLLLIRARLEAAKASKVGIPIEEYALFCLGRSLAVLAALGSLLFDLGPLLGRSWVVLGRSWDALGRSWGALGVLALLSAALGAVLASSRAPRAAKTSHRGLKIAQDRSQKP